MGGFSFRRTYVYNIISQRLLFLSVEINLGNTGVLKMLLNKRSQVVLKLGKLGNPLWKQCSSSRKNQPYSAVRCRLRFLRWDFFFFFQVNFFIECFLILIKIVTKRILKQWNTNFFFNLRSLETLVNWTQTIVSNGCSRNRATSLWCLLC